MPERYDIVFLGGGPAGYQGAIRAAQLGARVAVIEDRLLGGVCLNWGCIPTKTVRASAEIARSMRRAREFGFQPVEVIPDLAMVLARKDRVVAALRGSIAQLFLANQIEIIEGRGRFIGPRDIEISSDGPPKVIQADKVVVTTGSRPASLSVLPAGPGLFLADRVFNMTTLPVDLLVIGGGAVGVELAAVFRELGIQVTLIELADRLLPSEDAEMSEYLQGILRRRKIKVICGARIASATREQNKFKIALSDGTTMTPDTIFVAVGRLFNTRDIGLETTGVALHQGHIKVNKHMQTTVPHIYAAGDVVGNWLLAHVAFAEGICAAECARGMDREMDYRVIPRAVFSIPEYAAVGLTENEAQAGYKIKVGRFNFKSLGMGQALGEMEGLVKIIVDAPTDKILGAHIIGAHGAEMISEIALAMQAGLPSRMIMETIHIHPTLSEAVLEVAQALHDRAIHLPPQGPG